jgi:F-type H+-transporting ATPase subunit b
MDWCGLFSALLYYPRNFMEIKAILDQLGGLVLGAVPTMILFILLVMLYSVLVRRPLEKTLAERRSRTSGAVDQAKKAIAEAEAETAAYEAKLRAARAELAAARETRKHDLQVERDRVLDAARTEAQGLVRVARAEIEASAAGARKQIEEAAVELSQQILRTLLPKQGSATEARS